MIPSRGDVGLAECTRDPIFLLQAKQILYCSEHCPYRYDSDDEALMDGTVPVSDQRLIEEGWAVESWRTESVWFTREEAVGWAGAHAYRFSSGWRVYCVCAEGDLAAILKTRSLSPTGTMPL